MLNAFITIFEGDNVYEDYFLNNVLLCKEIYRIDHVGLTDTKTKYYYLLAIVVK